MKIEKLNETLEHIDMADKTYDIVGHTYATAVRDHKSNVERIMQMMKERSKNAVQDERQPKPIKNAMLKRMFLSEGLFENTRPLGKQKVYEANEDPAIDLSIVKTSMTSILSNLSKSEELQKCASAGDVLNLVKQTFEDNGLDTPASNRLLANLSRARTLFDAWSTVYNSILKGSRNGVIKEAGEKIWTYDTEDGDEWYDMASFIEDHLARSDITRPDEQVLTRIARISDVLGVSYKNLGRNADGWVTARVPLGKYDEDTEEIEISDNEKTKAVAKLRADKVIAAAKQIADMFKLGFTSDKNAADKFYEFAIEVPTDSIGQVYCIGDWFEENDLDLNVALTPAYQKRLAKREQLFANPDKNEEFLGKAKNESFKKIGGRKSLKESPMLDLSDEEYDEVMKKRKSADGVVWGKVPVNFYASGNSFGGFTNVPSEYYNNYNVWLTKIYRSTRSPQEFCEELNKFNHLTGDDKIKLVKSKVTHAGYKVYRFDRVIRSSYGLSDRHSYLEVSLNLNGGEYYDESLKPLKESPMVDLSDEEYADLMKKRSLKKKSSQYVGKIVRFDAYDDFEDDDEIMEYDGELCRILSPYHDSDDEFDDNYYDIEFEDGNIFDAISGSNLGKRSWDYGYGGDFEVEFYDESKFKSKNTKNESLKENREDFWLIETSKGIYKVNGKIALFDTQADADDFIDNNELKDATVMFADEDDIKAGHKMNESLTEDLKYGQTKYEELVGKIREYWDAPAIDNLCDLMKDIDEQAAYDIIYKCAEFLEEHADEAIEDSQKYPIEKPKAKDSGFVSAEDKQPKKDLLTEKEKVDESVVMNEEAKINIDLWSFQPWSDAIHTLDVIKDANKMEELDALLEDLYPEGIGETELNDLLRFEDDWIFAELGILDTGDEE